MTVVGGNDERRLAEVVGSLNVGTTVYRASSSSCDFDCNCYGDGGDDGGDFILLQWWYLDVVFVDKEEEKIKR